MLDDQDVIRKWRALFRDQSVSSQNLARAESLIEELRPESPLRVRLANEISDIRKLHSAPARRKR